MRVYYLTSERHALNNIKNNRIKISLLEDLNDPFELMGTELESEENKNAFDLLLNIVSKNWGVICFTKDWHNPLMWSHYGDKHKGVCLGFDINNTILKEVIYREKRIQFNVDMDLYGGGITEELIEDLLRYKYIDWKYEDEVRAWANLDEQDETGFYFMDFENNLQLREIILGPRSELKSQDINPILSDYKEDIKIKNTKLAFNSFEVIENV